MQWNIPNILTLLRIVLIPVLVVVFYLPGPWSYQISALIFGVAAITDWLDGYLARRLQQTSPFGAFLDPVADKLMVAVALVLLVQDNPSELFAVPAAVIIGREIVISALREWMAEIGARTRVAVSIVGKVKTTLQMTRDSAVVVQDSGGGVSHAYGWCGPAVYRRHPDVVVNVRLFEGRLAYFVG